MICGSIGSKTFIYDLYKTKKRCLNCAILPVGWAKQAKISRAIHGLLASGTMKGYQIVDLGYGSSRLHLVPLLVPWLSAILNISCSGRFVARRGRLWQESNGKYQWFSDSKFFMHPAAICWRKMERRCRLTYLKPYVIQKGLFSIYFWCSSWAL